MRSACEQHTRGAARGSGRSPVARDAQAALAAAHRRYVQLAAAAGASPATGDGARCARAEHAQAEQAGSAPTAHSRPSVGGADAAQAQQDGTTAMGPAQHNQAGAICGAWRSRRGPVAARAAGLRRGRLPSTEFNSRASLTVYSL